MRLSVTPCYSSGNASAGLIGAAVLASIEMKSFKYARGTGWIRVVNSEPSSQLLAAGKFGFFALIRSGDRPER